MANGGVTKGSPVEVSSDEPGFQGAWYVATFLARVQTKKRHLTKLGYLVKYHTLFKDDQFLEPLTEVVDPSFVRPLPPPNVLPNNGADAKEALVAPDAARDFELYDVIDAYHRDGWWVGVVKNVITEGGIRKYIVSFEDPPEEFEFEGSKLRLHVDWVDCRWLVPPKKQSGDRRNASDDAINSRSLNTSKTSSALDASVKYSRNKRSANSRGKRFQSSAGIRNKGSTKVIMSVLETSGCVDVYQDSPPVENRIIVTPTCVSEDGNSHQKRKRGRPPKLVVRKPIGIIKANGHSVSTDIDEQPLSVWYQGMHPRSVLKRSSYFSPYHLDNSVNQVVVTGAGTTTNYQKDWPFIKRSPIWTTIESLELYLTPPQKPHFSPLKTMKEDYREGFAIAYMVTFGNLVQRLSYLQMNDPVDIINNSVETLSELETHGFDVGSFQGRLKELLSLKSKSCQHEDKLKDVEKELEKCNHEKSLVEKEMDQLNVKMLELQEKMMHTVTMQKAKEEEIMRLQSSLHLVSNQVTDWELAFNELAATPL